MATSNLGCGSLTIKYLVFLFNLIFFLSGLVLIVIGGVAQGFFKEYVQFFDNEFKTPAMVMIALGSLILVISFFGCCGARMENVCMLRTFAFFLSFLLVCEVVAGISIAVLRSDIKAEVENNMNITMHEYGKDDNLATNTWDNIQTNLHCCGTYNYTDWKTVKWSDKTNVPDTCCKTVTPGCGNDTLVNPVLVKNIYPKGCAASLKDSALRNVGAIIGGAVAIAIIQIIGIWMSCALVRAVKEHYEVL